MAMPLKDFEEMRVILAQSASKKTLAVVYAMDHHTVEAAVLSKRRGVALPTLIGDHNKMIELLRHFNEEEAGYNLVQADDPVAAAQTAVDLVKKGEADCILKGAVQTGDLMRAVLSGKTGIRNQQVASHVCLLDLPDYHKILVTTDGAMNLSPNMEERIQILNNSLFVLKKLGYTNPKVGVLEANELVNNKVPTSQEAEMMKEMNRRGEIMGCIIEGPISFDLAVDRKACEAKGYKSEVGGDVDILLCPYFTVANAMTKALQTFGKARTSGVVIGAKVPIVLVSRASEAEEKYDSIVLAMLVN